MIVRGHWNLGILSPNWIATKLFGMPPGQPIRVLVALDYGKANRIQTNDQAIEVRPSAESLYIGTVESSANVRDFMRAINYGVISIKSLPVTPLMAAGINFDLVTDIESDRVRDILNSDILDKPLYTFDYTIAERHVKRTIEFRNGYVNVSIKSTISGNIAISFNFHLSSNSDSELIQWMELEMSERLTVIKNICDTLGYELREDFFSE